MNNPNNTEVTLRFLAAPTDAGFSGSVDAGFSGSVDAGTVLEWVDKAAYAAAVGWAKTYCVTAYVGNIHFEDPVVVGDMVEVRAQLVYTGRTSMHIKTVVSSGDPRSGEVHMRSSCLVVFVSVDEHGKPSPVQQLEPADEEAKKELEYALSRIEVRNQIQASGEKVSFTDAGTAERVKLRFLAAPTDVNWGGKVHGGIVMRWIDEAAYVCSSRWCGKPTVSVFSGGVQFFRPLHIGDLVEVEARLVYTGNKGMHVAVHVRSGDPKADKLELTTYSLTVMVARDETGTAVPIRPWTPVSEEDKVLAAHARELLEIRGAAPGGRLPDHLLQ